MAYLEAKRAWDDATNDELKTNLLAIAYAFLQRVIGAIAIALPVAVAVGDRLIDHQGIRGSISSYYYGRMGGWFVGSLCALGVFFLSYEHHPRDEGHHADNVLANFACLFAVGVALFPTSSDGGGATGGSMWISRVHVASASALFACLAMFSLNSFTKSLQDRGRRFGRAFTNPPEVVRGTRRWTRNLIHRFCGWTIVGSMIGIAINNTAKGPLMFWFESLAVWAFGFSWLVKSDWMPFFRDPADDRSVTAAVDGSSARLDDAQPSATSSSR